MEMDMLVSTHSEYDFEMANISESALSCEIRQIEGSPLPLSPTVTNVVKYIQSVYYIGGLPISLLLNIYLIVIVAKFKSLHHLSYYLILQVIATDIIHCIILFPGTATNILVNGWAFGADMCPVTGMLITWVRFSRNFLMVVLSLDRLCSVFMPFWYARHRVKIVVPLSVSAWLVSFIMALIGVPGMLNCYAFQRFTWFCVLGSGCENPSACDAYRNFTVSLSVFSLFVSLLMYGVLYIKAKKINKIVVPSLSTIGTDSQTAEISTDNNGTRNDISESASTELQSVLTNRQHREKRATVTLFFLFLALFGVVFPSFLFFIIGTSVLKHLQISRPPSAYIIAAIVSRSLFSSLVIIDPIALMRNADVRKVNLKIFKQFKRAIACKASPIANN